jgi:VanZ family protein
MTKTIYRTIFWLGYTTVLAASFITLKNDLHKITFDVISFKFHLDQVLHTVVYFLICMYFLAGKHYGLTLFKDNSIKWFLPVVLFLATFTEVVQLFVPSRAFNVFDMLANVIGVGVGLMVMWLVGRVGSRE